MLCYAGYWSLLLWRPSVQALYRCIGDRSMAKVGGGHEPPGQKPSFRPEAPEIS